MKSNELRIGNLVRLKKSQEEILIYQITFERKDGHLINGQIPVDHSEGIPLTEEWLLKFGFITSDAEVDYMEYEKNGVQIGNDGGLNGANTSPFYFQLESNWSKKEIKYVHQLQNLYFALTGEELEIKEVVK